MTEQHSYRFWITCPHGVQGLLKHEIKQITGETAEDWHHGVAVNGALEVGYRLCLWSRLANRVYLSLAETSEVGFDALAEMVQGIDWDDHLKSTGTLKVAFQGRLPEIRESRYGAQKVKDWVVDQFRARHGVRPSVDSDPDATIFVQVAKKKMFLGLELSGDSLHRRGYRQATGPAPIKENLAAAMLYANDWPERSEKGESFIDLMCGSGTVLIEAALMSADIAPGLSRPTFAFERWLQHKRDIWIELRKEARQRREQGIQRLPVLLGYDADGGVVAKANATIERLGLHEKARCYHKGLSDWVLPTHWTLKAGLCLLNPPYGERLGTKPEVLAVYQQLGDIARGPLNEWHFSFITSDSILARETGLSASEKKSFKNGPLDVDLYQFNVERRNEQKQAGTDEQTLAFKNRIKKNQQARNKWLKKNSVEAYRIYDADLPDFALAIDRYGPYLHVQEYAPPKTIPEEKSQARLLRAVAALAEFYDMPMDDIIVKRRERQRGKKQYERQDKSGRNFSVNELGVKLQINLWDYLDTGLFLDHRPLRQTVHQEAQGKTVLNLFCYTGSFTAHAAVGGAKATTSVDLSKTYLKWAQDNLKLNGVAAGKHHRFEHADCFAWLKNCQEKFDLIVMDPPTFSNSARMKDTLDIQRDHIDLVTEAMRCLTDKGTLYFSNNFKKFKLDESLQRMFEIKDISKGTIPEDFKRKAPHVCFKIRHR